ncbi:MAG: hypothetical protein AVDCRST_MAG78-223, partial [uncultured Rubrobacteraceae bacterium]
GTLARLVRQFPTSGGPLQTQGRRLFGLHAIRVHRCTAQALAKL